MHYFVGNRFAAVDDFHEHGVVSPPRTDANPARPVEVARRVISELGGEDGAPIESHGWTTFTSHHCPLNEPGSSEACMASLSTSQRFGQLNAALCGVLPPILGLVLGVPLGAGELEKRTNRLAWTQSITKTRWLLSKVGVGVLVVAGVIGLMAPLIWWWTDAAQRSSHIQPSNFDITGIAAVSYGIFAFMLGATLGALLRHTGWALLPALRSMHSFG
jgi:hypothetical protein